MREIFEKIKLLPKTHKTLIAPSLLIGGFIFDLITLNRIDSFIDNLVLGVHLFIVAASIALIHRGSVRGDSSLLSKAVLSAENLMAFSLGGLFSGFFIFYTKSASLVSSWPFLILLLGVMLGTEFYKKFFQHIVTKVSFLYLSLFLYLTFLLPVLTKKISPFIFILGGVLSLVLIFCYQLFLSYSSKKEKISILKKFSPAIIGIFLFMIMGYFMNLIPPVPLALKHQDVYYSVSKNKSTYSATYETTPWWNILNKTSNTLAWKPGEDIYVFGSVFAPTKLSTTISHQWYFKNKKGRWEQRDLITIPINGGRQDGYRGYTKKRNLQHGTWKVKIVNHRNQSLGQTKFTLENFTPNKKTLSDL